MILQEEKGFAIKATPRIILPLGLQKMIFILGDHQIMRTQNGDYIGWKIKQDRQQPIQILSVSFIGDGSANQHWLQSAYCQCLFEKPTKMRMSIIYLQGSMNYKNRTYNDKSTLQVACFLQKIEQIYFSSQHIDTDGKHRFS